jgi:S-DNA-T family DNA segregation ATPase FtsK/SpoIIIE
MRRYGLQPMVVINSGDQLPELAAIVIARLAWRYRSELAPFNLAIMTALAALVLHATRPDWWRPILATAMVAASVLAGAGDRVGLPRRSERLYAAAVITATGSWAAAAVAFGPTRPPLPLLLLAAGLILAVPWWAHRRRRAKVRVMRTVAAWPQLAERMGLPGSRVMSAVVDAWGWTARLALRPGQTAAEAIGRIPAIESALGARPGAVRVESDPARANHLVMRVLSTDPHARAIDWRPPGITTITEPIPLGLFEDATQVGVLLLRRHGLIGGVVGSGKSGVVNVILAALVACRDVVLWGIDLKGGMELAPWAPCLGWLATTAEQATELLADAVAELDARAQTLAARGARVWEPTPERPALMIIIDEYAELADTAPEAISHAESIARRGRAPAVTLLAATQRPTQKAMGHGATRSQMDTRICLRVRERRDADLILGQGAHAAGWHPHTLDAPGKFLISDPEHGAPRRARAYLVRDRDVAAAVARNAPHRPALPTQDADNGRPAGDAEERPERPTGTPRPDTTGPTLGQDPGNAQTPETRLWAALLSAPEEGAHTAALIKITGKSRRWIYYRLTEHADAGRVIQPSRGRWRALPPYRNHTQ